MKANYNLLILLPLFGLMSLGCSSTSDDTVSKSSCSTLLCRAAKYSLFVADIDGANLSLIKTSSYQDMTHPRVSGDKSWVAYTTYHDLNSSKCATLDQAYLNTEIRVIKMTGADDKSLIGPVAGKLNSNNYWIGTSNEFTYLSGAPASLKLYRATVNSSMNVVSGPTQIAVPGTVIPMDPSSNATTNKIVFSGLYNPGGGYIKSIFMMNLSDSSNLVGLSVGRDRAGTPIICENSNCANIMENDPKISPDGSKVAFMRQVPSSGVNGFGWHIFVVPVASPQNEVDISYSTLGSDTHKNDVLPEWVSNSKIIFSTIDFGAANIVSKNVYTMNTDGTGRTKISLPDGFLYADIYPFTDSNGKSRIILSAEKIGATCIP